MRITKQEINNLISLLKSSNSEDWDLAINILANPSFKVKRQLCQAVKFAKIYSKHPYLIYYGDNYIWTVSQCMSISRRCLKYLELYKNYDKRRIK